LIVILYGALRQHHLRYVFSPLLGSGGGGVVGLQTVAVLGGMLACVTSFFFGFFFSRPLLSRLPIALSSHRGDVAPRARRVGCTAEIRILSISFGAAQNPAV